MTAVRDAIDERLPTATPKVGVAPAMSVRPAPADDMINRLERLAALHASGALTAGEFAAAKRHGYRQGVTSWRLTDRVLELAEPIGAGIVNVTTDSMYEGARSGTPEGAIADGVALAEAGFEMLDVGAVAARSGPPVPPRG